MKSDELPTVRPRRSFIFSPGLQPEMFPKALACGADIVWPDNLLTERGHATRLHVIIETNAGLEAVHDIARASGRIDALFFGGVDMAAELRCRNAWEPLLYAGSRVVHAAASVGIDAIDVPFLDLEDPDGMAREATRDLNCRAREALARKLHESARFSRRRKPYHRTTQYQVAARHYKTKCYSAHAAPVSCNMRVSSRTRNTRGESAC